MDLAINAAAVKNLHWDDHQQQQNHPADSRCTESFGEGLKTLNAFSPQDFLCKRWIAPESFTLNSSYKMPRLDNQSQPFSPVLDFRVPHPIL